jgi:hypothetical protein
MLDWKPLTYINVSLLQFIAINYITNKKESKERIIHYQEGWYWPIIPHSSVHVNVNLLLNFNNIIESGIKHIS